MGTKKTTQKIEPYNRELIFEWALRQSSLRKAKTILADRADISVGLAEQLIKGTYPCVPKPDTRLRICRVIGRSESEVFPGASGKAS